MVLVLSFDDVGSAEVVTVTVVGTLLLVVEADVLVVRGIAAALSATGQLISTAINRDVTLEL
jgi:hypothetical protein